MAGMFAQKVPIQSTAGAIPIKNDKGELTMEKVKVQRYVTGKRPDFAPEDSSGSDSETEFAFGKNKKVQPAAPEVQEPTEKEQQDRRLRRMVQRRMDESSDEDEEEDRVARHRRLVQEPELLGNSDEEEEEKEPEAEESSEDEMLDDEEIERRRALLRMKARQQREEEEVMDKEEEKSEGESEEESSEYEEYTDSEEEETGPRLKPVFVRKKDRITIQQKEEQEQKQKDLELEAKVAAEDRRRQTLRMIEEQARKELEQSRSTQDACDAIDTDEDNDEEEYEAWKVRELRRIKRDREEREALEKEKLEIDRVHNMTEEERRMEAKMNPKQVTNKAQKGKYKFLQKYYHRGAFFMDQEENNYTRDFSQPTLEDHFNKTILPKVMQVKNFGRSGRTKYTHLVDQDTTQFESPWSDKVSSDKFSITKGGGMKQSFERPSIKNKKKN